MGSKAVFAAKLLSGEMPQDIEQAFEAAGVSLFPSQRNDLKTDCSCPDYANPCKHIAATHYILGERFDEDPFLIFRLRGRTQEQVMQELRKRRSGVDELVDEEAGAGHPLQGRNRLLWKIPLPIIGIWAHRWKDSPFRSVRPRSRCR